MGACTTATWMFVRAGREQASEQAFVCLAWARTAGTHTPRVRAPVCLCMYVCMYLMSTCVTKRKSCVACSFPTRKSGRIPIAAVPFLSGFDSIRVCVMGSPMEGGEGSVINSPRLRCIHKTIYHTTRTATHLCPSSEARVGLDFKGRGPALSWLPGLPAFMIAKGDVAGQSISL